MSSRSHRSEHWLLFLSLDCVSFSVCMREAKQGLLLNDALLVCSSCFIPLLSFNKLKNVKASYLTLKKKSLNIFATFNKFKGGLLAA